jgi:2-(1,2-epoxy-1,2-dihydrophenyl)acetyl-CoA isomerase
MSTSLSSPNESVSVDVRDAVCWITFNRPKSLNAINDDLVAALANITEALKDSTDVRAVVMQGEGDHFMAGGDIKKFERALAATMDKDELRQQFSSLLDNVHKVIFNMRALPQPIVASVKGAVAGAGVSMMLACDLVLAADSAFFTLAYCHLGVSPDGGSTYHLPRMVGLKRSFEIALLGDRFDAETAERWGMINRVVPTADLMEETEKLAKRLATGPSYAHAQAKKLLNNSLNNPIRTQLDAETAAFADCTTTADFREGVTGFIEKRSPEFKGS